MKTHKFQVELKFPSTPEEWEFEGKFHEAEKLAGLLGELMINAAYRIMSVGMINYLDHETAFETIILPTLIKYDMDTNSSTYWKAFHQLRKIDFAANSLIRSQ